MQTQISTDLLSTPTGIIADRIIRSCVHCGFCTATCPTYQILGDELDSPRGRIYLIKQILEGHEPTQVSQLHLDRCLNCRSCETTCPSGVEYSRLLHIGKSYIKQSFIERQKRYWLRQIIPYPKRYKTLLSLSRLVKPILPKKLKQYIPASAKAEAWQTHSHDRQVLILEGCVQSVSTPETSQMAVQLLDKLGIEVLRIAKTGCCGALSHHLGATEEALNFMRANIDAWSPYLDQVEAIISSASGCGLELKEYGQALAADPDYAAKAQQISDLSKDLSELIVKEDLSQVVQIKQTLKVAFHSPCTLQHGQKVTGVIETILANVGYTLVPIQEGHLCCGSAGTYSILQPKLSNQLRDNKVRALEASKPDIITTANIGCQLHIGVGANVSVKHWIALLS